MIEGTIDRQINGETALGVGRENSLEKMTKAVSLSVCLPYL